LQFPFETAKTPKRVYAFGARNAVTVQCSGKARNGNAMLIIDTSHPLYRRLWVRLLIVGFCAAWSVIEFVNREAFWGTVVGGVAVYSAYELLLKFKPASGENAAAKGDAGKDDSDEPAESAPADKNDAG
jgi:hypothetical protein